MSAVQSRNDQLVFGGKQKETRKLNLSFAVIKQIVPYDCSEKCRQGRIALNLLSFEGYCA